MCVGASLGFAAGSGYATVEKVGQKNTLYQVAWTADASGDCDAVTIRVPAGIIHTIKSDPESGVMDDFDVVLIATWNIAATATTTRTIDFADALTGQGTNLSNSVDGEVIRLTRIFSMPSGELQVVISNAGNATSGTFFFEMWSE